MDISQPLLTPKTPWVRPAGTLLLTRRDVCELLNLDLCIAAVERAFALHADGKTLTPGVLGISAPDGGFHIKAAGLALDRLYFSAKINANFPANQKRFGLPTIQGVIALCDGETGYPLALIDSIEITALRTAAATAVAAKFLARPESATATICGCGVQGRAQLAALAHVLPIRRCFAHDLDPECARDFSAEMTKLLGFAVMPVNELKAALQQSDVCVTCTPSRQSFIHHGMVVPGTFIAAVGADSHDKQEIEPALLAASTLVVDILDQCAGIGELHHALVAGVLTRSDVHAELADIVAGRRPGRSSAEEITIFDSTGTALQDVAAAVAVYECAQRSGRGVAVDFSR